MATKRRGRAKTAKKIETVTYNIPKAIDPSVRTARLFQEQRVAL